MILFYTDPHFGLSRRSYFTERTLRAREDQCLAYLEALTQRHPVAFCLGDLFDRPYNPEHAIARVLTAIDTTDYVLAGNHDLLNRDGSVSSLQLIQHVTDGKVITEPSRITAMAKSIVMIPHCRTQTDFEMQLDQAGSGDILCLHCNYDSPFADKEQELNLTRERAEQLLERFKFILLGHEHAAADHFDGRLKIIGSLFPTSFGDVGAKHRALVYDGDFTEIVTPVAYYRGPASTCPDGQEFYELDDDLSHGEAARLAVRLLSAGALAVKIHALEAGPGEGTLIPVLRRDLVGQIEARIEAELPALLPLWEELLQSEAS